MSWLKKKNNFKRLGFANVAPSNFSLLHGSVKAQGSNRHKRTGLDERD